MSEAVKGARSLQRKFAAMKEAARRTMQRNVKRSLLNVESNAKRNVRVDRGGLRNSIAHRVDPDGMNGVVGTNSVYARPTEFGRRPGSHPPVDPLIGWARRQGIADPERAAWAIAKKILREGIAAAPFLFPAMEEERPRFMERLRAELAQEIRAIAQETGGPA